MKRIVLAVAMVGMFAMGALAQSQGYITKLKPTQMWTDSTVEQRVDMVRDGSINLAGIVVQNSENIQILMAVLQSHMQEHQRARASADVDPTDG